MIYCDKEGDCMAFDKGKYDKEYAKTHITRKFIPFNDTVPEDAELLKWLDTVGNVTQYVKQLIREDMLVYRDQHLTDKEKKTLNISGKPSPDFNDPLCELCTDENRADCKKHDNAIKIELVDDFEDKEAIEKATKERHRIYHDLIGYHDVIIDLDLRKVLKVKNRCPLTLD